MPVPLERVLERVAAKDPDLAPDRLRQAVLETIAALGLELGRDGQIYDPAACAAPVRVVPRDDRGYYVRGIRNRR